MTSEKSQLKFARSEETGELIGFVSRHSKTRKLMGVREDSRFGKQICVLSEDLKGTLEPNILYSVELKPMHKANGYVVVAATPVLFQAHVETVIVPKTLYQVTVTFGNKKIFFDPKDGKSVMSRTIDGVLEILKGRKDIKYKEGVITDYLNQARALVRRMESDGFIYTGDQTSGRNSMKEKPVVGIATDGAHSAKERLTRFRAVDLSSGKELFSKAIGNWTNNIGEFLGIVEAVRYVMEHPESPRTIYSDSITAITWYRNKQTASSRRCPALQKAEIFLKVMEARIKDIEVLHWDNRLWGEIPADFGNK